jgi:phospholipid/cholesterol/gamma-HCH transport system ATP-binding protein
VSSKIPKIQMVDVSKQFGEKVVLNRLNLSVFEGESLVILGGSGTGKSVLLKCILGIIRPDSGKIYLDGQEITGLKGKEREEMLALFGMLFQGGALFDSLKVWENVSFRPVQSGTLSVKEGYELAIKTLEKVGLSADVAKLSPSELSGGMQKRVSLARAIASKPSILFFDEPTTGLDPMMADVINRLIISTVKEMGATAMTITHDMHSMRTIADRVAMLYKGNILWQGNASTIDQSGNVYVDHFIHGRAEGLSFMA